jgi:predicted permease
MLTRWCVFLRSLVGRSRAEREIDDETRFHLESSAAMLEERGMSRQEAWRQAVQQFGNVTVTKEEMRDQQRLQLLDDAWADLRYAARALRRSPVFTLVAVSCLALGIGANTAIFTLIDATLLRMLPVADPERLVALSNRTAERVSTGFSHPQFEYLRQHAGAAAAMFAYGRMDLNLSTGELTDAPTGLMVSDSYFSSLGVVPAMGRLFSDGNEPVAVLSYRYWQQRFSGDPAVLHRTIRINGLPFTVVGVAPPHFFGTEVGRSPDLFMPLGWYDRVSPGRPRLRQPNMFWLTIMARLRPDVTVAAAAAQTDLAFHQGIPEWAPSEKVAKFLRGWRIVLTPAARGIRGLGERFATPLAILMAVVVLVLLIACTNVANLLLARAAVRHREIAVRLALGASRGRLVRQFLTESLVLSIAGGALGLVFGLWSAAALTRFLPGAVLDVTLDRRVLGFTVLASLLTGVVFGAVPGIRGARADVNGAFRGDPAAGTRLRGLRVLVSGQVAMSLVLIIGAGLFLQTLRNLRSLDPGFRADHVLLAEVNPGLSGYAPDRASAFFADLVGRVSALPGVRAASLADAPLLGGTWIDGLFVEGEREPGEARYRIAGPGFFQTMGIALRAGRDFSARDDAGSPNVAIVNETLARRYFAGRNPIGKRIGLGRQTDMTIVGVIGDTKYRDLRETVPITVYLPMAQHSAGTRAAYTLHVRTFANPADMAGAIRMQVRALDKNMPVEIRLFSELIDENLAQERLIATLSGFFGGLALLLTAMGLYGVIAYGVQRRTRDIGIRISLGAGRRAVEWMVVRDSLLLAGLGVAVGVPASLWLSRLVRQQLFGVTATDPATIAAASLFLVAVAVLAGYLPARHAARVDPMVALRQE